MLEGCLFSSIPSIGVLFGFMGLSSLPAPSEGILSVLLVNTALSISAFKSLTRAILDLIRLHHPSLRNSASPSSSDSNQPESQAYGTGPSESYMDLFRSQTKTLRFDVLRRCHNEADPDACGRAQDCSVCLTEFAPSEINVLSCGHVFHRKCLEKWMVYWNITCPLCRSPFLPEEEEEDHVSDSGDVQ